MKRKGKYIKCPICNTDFYVKQSHLKFRKCCSRKCDGVVRSKKPAWNKGIKGVMKPNSGSFKKGHPAPKTAFKKGHTSWNTGTAKEMYKSNQGYIWVHQPFHPFCNKQKYVPRSRLVMEQHIGQYLTKQKIVHHINGIKDDDRIENLKLFANESSHCKHHHPKGVQFH